MNRRAGGKSRIGMMMTGIRKKRERENSRSSNASSSTRHSLEKKRGIRQVETVNEEEGIYSRAELDSHDDTCGVGSMAYVIQDSGRFCEVTPFSSVEAMQEILIVKAALACDNPLTGETSIINIGQALYFRDQVDHILMNPNQIRMNGVVVDENPAICHKACHPLILYIFLKKIIGFH